MIDTHCHLEEYADIDFVLEKMRDGLVITSGVNQETNDFVVNTVTKYPNLYGTIGIHPEEVDTCTEEDFHYIEKHLKDPKIVGIGEIGLDYHYTKENIEKQKEVFKRQLFLAKKYKKTVVIHSRDSALDTYTILKEADLGNHKIVLHCYGYSLEMAKRFLEWNVMLGIGGVVTFKNGIKLGEVVKDINIDRLLLETDSPYLSPEPYRGKRNEPYNVYFVARKIADIKKIPLEMVLKTTTENAIRQFDLPNKV